MLSAENLPQHVAIIMDGNGRWAEQRKLPRAEGHRQGTKTVREIVKAARAMGIKYLTLYVFSNENWGRPQDEVSALMSLFERYLQSELNLMLDNQIRLRAMGQLDRLPSSIARILKNTEERTAEFSAMQLILAVSYGSRQEILAGVQKLAKQCQDGELEPENITEDLIAKSLYLPDVPAPDLLIRTSGEMRISNFMLWQLAYTEIVVTESLWPDFSPRELQDCVENYCKRERRFGLTSDQRHNLVGTGS